MARAFTSPYGADDQIGMLNEIHADKVRSAVRLVNNGRVYDLGHVLDEHVPAFPGRSFRQHLVTSAHQLNKRRVDAGPAGWGQNSVNWVIDVVSATSQMGTHIDGLNHLQIGDTFYNGFTLGEVVEDYGTNKLGMETVPQIVTRGLLLNIAAVKGIDHLGGGEIITVADIEAALQQQQQTVARGDVVLFHTGWGNFWMKDNDAYLSGQPGPGMEAAEWLVEQGVALTGCDTWSYGPVPPEDPAQPFIVPQTLNVRHGMFIVENLHTAELARDEVYKFLFILSHARVRGATGAWVSPLAVC
ncbi:MAG: cyclase family protein [Anaerolineae bacterium]